MLTAPMRPPLALAICCWLLGAFFARTEEPVIEHTRALTIVASERFHSELTRYVDHKQQQLPTRLESLENIVATCPGADEPEKLKRFLYDQWKQRATGYVLLVGDADVLPVRYMVLDRITPAAFDYAFYPSDLYYSDLAKQDGSFEDWNARKEGFHAGYYGEVRGEKNKDDGLNYDRIDYRPEIAVGRWPVSSAREVAILVAKTIEYETGLATRAAQGTRRAALFSVGGWVDSRPQMDAAAGAIAKLGWSIDKRYYADKRRTDGTPPPSRDEFVSLANAGSNLIIHAGHGQDDQWEQSVSTKDLPALNNGDRLPIVMSVGCSTARFATLPPYEPYVDVKGVKHAGTNHGEVFTEPPPPPAVYQSGTYNPPGFGELLLRTGATGAVAYIGCNTGSQPCGLTLLEGFTQALGQPKASGGNSRRLGDCWSHAVIHYYEKEDLANLQPNASWYPASIFFQAMKFMVFGDPSLLIPE
jgi:hypothetical protein